MRTFDISKYEFDDLFFPAISSQGSDNEDELEVAMRVIRKLRHGDYTKLEQLSKERLDEAARFGRKLVPQRFLISDSTTFTFEEDEYNLIVKRLTRAIPTFSNAVAPELFDLLERVKKAPKEIPTTQEQFNNER